MSHILSLEDYNSLISYYKEMDIYYQKVWGSHLHFGTFAGISKDLEYSIDEAGEDYSRNLISLGLSVLPLYRRRAEDLVIVELCCGKAPLYPYFKKMHIKGSYFGTDIIKQAINECHRRYIATSHEKEKLKAFFQNKTAEQFLEQFKSKSFCRNGVDLVVCQDSLYHIKYKFEIFKSVQKVLRPGGIFLFSDLAVQQSLKTDSIFDQSFISRQAQSYPLTFRKNNSIGIIGKTKTNFYEFECEKLLKEAGFFIVEREDHTEDLQATYEKALQNINELDCENDEMSENLLSVFKKAFANLRTFANDRLFKLQWWVTVRKNISYESTRKKNQTMVTLTVDKSGYTYENARNKKGTYKSPVLDEMVFKVRKNEYIGLVGKTGVGKTTLLNGIMGLLPSNTSIKVHKNTDKIVIVNQDPILFEEFTVRKAIEIVFKASGNNSHRPEIINNLSKIILKCNLGKVSDNQMTELSRGQKQRAAIAMALAANPDVLLLDEPLASQDYIQKEQMIILLQDLKKNDPKLTIVHVTHVWEDVENLADCFYEITGGQLIEVQKNK